MKYWTIVNPGYKHGAMLKFKDSLKNRIRIENKQKIWRDYFFIYRDKKMLMEKKPGEDEHIAKWTFGGLTPDPIYYRAFYNSHSNKDLSSFIPFDQLFIVIYPVLNRLEHFRALSDKNLYDKLYTGKLFPETYLRKINGSLYDRDYKLLKPNDSFFEEIAEKEEKLILKPATNSYGGQNVVLFRKAGKSFYAGEQLLTADYLNVDVRGNWILQEYIDQNSFANALNHSSLNSVRLITYRSVKTEEIHIIGSYLRIGTPDSFTDNLSGTGYATELDSNGLLSGTAYNLSGYQKTEFGGIQLSDAGYYPHYGKVKEAAIKIAELMPYQRVLGLDLVVDKYNKVRLIEVNNKNVAPVQLTGTPYFGEFTDEVLEYCKNMIAP